MFDTTSKVSIAVLTNQDSISNNALVSSLVRALHKVTLNMPPTGLTKSAYHSNTISVYPNPTTDVLHIQSEKNIVLSNCVLWDVTGKEILLTPSENNTINVSSLATGLYILYVKDEIGEVVYSQKIQIIR